MKKIIGIFAIMVAMNSALKAVCIVDDAPSEIKATVMADDPCKPEDPPTTE